MDNNYDFLPEIDLISKRAEIESKSISAFWKDGGKKVNVGELTTLPDFLKKLIPQWIEFAKHITQPDWYVKHANTVFKYEDTWYYIYPSDIDCSDEVFDKMSDKITNDLLTHGIEHIHYNGMLD